MCFGSDDSSVESTSELPEYIQNFSENTLDYADLVSDRPYTPYGGQRVAQFNPDTLRAFDMTRDNAGAWVPSFNQAEETSGAVANREQDPWYRANIRAYMNPYIQQVMNRSLSEVDRKNMIDQNRLKAQVAAGGAYGGARHGILEGEQKRNQADLRQNFIADLLSGAYSDAAQQYRADQAQRLQSDQLRLGAAGQLQRLGAQGTQLGYADAAAQLDIGDRQQAQQQAGLDQAYMDFLRQWNYPIDMLNLRTGVLAQQPYTTSSLQEQSGGGGGASEAIGTAASIAGIAALAFSSKDFKYDDQPADTILKAVERLPVRAWRYRPEMGLGDDVHVGPYAEDFHDIFGLGDGKTIPYVDGMGVNLAATKELSQRVAEIERRI